MFVLFLLLGFVNFAFAGEPIATVAQKKVHIKNVRKSLTNNTPSAAHNKRCWIALGLSTAALAASATFVAVALNMYENTELPADDVNNRFVAHSPQNIACYISWDPKLRICFFKDQLLEIANQFAEIHIRLDYKKQNEYLLKQ